MSMNNALPALSSDTGLSKYLQDIQNFPLLSEKEEYNLAVRCRDLSDIDAAHVLITSHLRLVASIALKYKNYGLPITDLIAEGNLGLMHAVKKFDPEMGFRLSTYALWWIKAAIHDYILKSWSLVKIGTSAVQKKLFFNLNKIKNKLLNCGEQINDCETVIAKRLNVSVKDVKEMDDKINNHIYSLNVNNNDDSRDEYIDMIADQSSDQETLLLEGNERCHKTRLVNQAMNQLNQREQYIIKNRILSEVPVTLEILSQKYKVSKERIRQVESNALDKIRKMINNK